MLRDVPEGGRVAKVVRWWGGCFVTYLMVGGEGGEGGEVVGWLFGHVLSRRRAFGQPQRIRCG